MTGTNGDFYLDLDSGDVYLKITGTWTFQMNIKGPKGDTGDTGAPGAPGAAGSTWYSGHGAPT